jgi:hypothetical protein
MPQFRLTQKFSKDIKISFLSEPYCPDNILDDWFIDVFRVSRKKIAIATHAKSTFTLFTSYAQTSGATGVVKNISSMFKNFLAKQGLLEYSRQAEILFNEPYVFCKTSDRKILGHMNDFKNCAYSFIDRAERLDDSVLWEHVSNRINNMPVHFGSEGYIYPIEMLGKLLGHQLAVRK